LPPQFFYLNRINYLFGGFAVYYLGIYSFGATVSKANERAYRLSRLQGIECLAVFLGTLLSPYIFMQFGYYGNFLISAACYVFAIAYLVVVVEEPLERKRPEADPNPEGATTPKSGNRKWILQRVRRLFDTVVATPLRELWKMLRKDRDRFDETPFRPKTFRINFLPQILDKVQPKNNINKFISGTKYNNF
jgi:MFS family permease